MLLGLNVMSCVPHNERQLERVTHKDFQCLWCIIISGCAYNKTLFWVRSMVCLFCFYANFTIKPAILYETKYNKGIECTKKTPFIWMEARRHAPKLHINSSHPEWVFHLENQARFSTEDNLCKMCKCCIQDTIFYTLYIHLLAWTT